MANQHAFYDSQHEEVNAIFQAEEIDWDRLTPLLNNALADPHLPRWYRAKFEAIAACDGDYDSAKEHIERAKEVIEDMRAVLDAEGRDSAYIEERLAPVVEMVTAIEEDLAEVSEEYDPSLL